MDIFIAFDLTLGRRVRLERLSRCWRQIDLASAANVQLADVTAIEKDRYLSRNRRQKILKTLGLNEKTEVKG
jgi:transcriptional regulator with XRE-family HTH domain